MYRHAYSTGTLKAENTTTNQWSGLRGNWRLNDDSDRMMHGHELDTDNMQNTPKAEIRDTTGNILSPGMYGYETALAAHDCKALAKQRASDKVKAVTDSRTVAKTTKSVLNTIKVGIIETDVFGAKAYHAKCLNCDWQTKRFDHQETAIAWAKRHVRHIKPSARLARQLKYAEAMGAINRAANENDDETPFRETKNATNYNQ